MWAAKDREGPQGNSSLPKGWEEPRIRICASPHNFQYSKLVRTTFCNRGQCQIPTNCITVSPSPVRLQHSTSNSRRTNNELHNTKADLRCVFHLFQMCTCFSLATVFCSISNLEVGKDIQLLSGIIIQYLISSAGLSITSKSLQLSFAEV